MHVDACNINASWVNAGKPLDDTPRVGRRIESALVDAPQGVVPDAAALLVQAIDDGHETMVFDAGDRLVAVCEDEGWEPLEG